jgi:hypothetical protein
MELHFYLVKFDTLEYVKGAGVGNDPTNSGL